jgi:hypothetical protein
MTTSYTPHSAPEADKLHNTKTAAPYIGVQAGTLEIWRSTGRVGLPYIKVGRLVKYRQSDLDAFLQRHTRTQTA